MITDGIDTIVFDLDGVLVDSLDDLCDSVNYTLSTIGIRTMGKGDIRKHIGMGNRNLIMKAAGTADAALTEKALGIFMAHYRENCTKKTVLRKGVKELLEAVKDRHLAILSNKYVSLTEKITKELGIYEYFPVILGPDRIKKLKPDPEGIRMIIGIYGTKPGDTLVLGDSDTDIYAGKKAHTVTCGILGGIGDETGLIGSQPDYIISEVSELFDPVYIANR